MNVAAIDIGTNSVRLLITDPQGRARERRMQITRLGQGVDQSGSLHPDAIARTLSVLEEYGQLLRRHSVQKVRATATSAARDAHNRDGFFAAVQAALGIRPELLSGEEEAALSFQGATAGLDRQRGPFLVIDIGGGSTEFVLGTDAPEAAVSLDMGCVRMAERHLRDDPPSQAQIQACFEDVRAQLKRVTAAMDVRRARCAIGLAGTVTALACMQQGLVHYDPQKTHHALLLRSQVEALFARLSGVNAAQRRSMLAEPKRAEVIVAGAAILLTLMRELDVPELMVSESDILDGLAASLV